MYFFALASSSCSRAFVWVSLSAHFFCLSCSWQDVHLFGPRTVGAPASFASEAPNRRTPKNTTVAVGRNLAGNPGPFIGGNLQVRVPWKLDPGKTDASDEELIR